MRLLLDTHTFIWYVLDNQRISNTVRFLINDADHEVLLSITSIWEIAIKQSTGKLSFNLPLKTFIEQQLNLNDFNLLNISIDHLMVVATLPFYHRDPFDRMLIAQAMVEQTPIISADSAFDSYPIQRLW